jgi:hypothetical protein
MLSRWAFSASESMRETHPDHHRQMGLTHRQYTDLIHKMAQLILGSCVRAACFDSTMRRYSVKMAAHEQPQKYGSTS